MRALVPLALAVLLVVGCGDDQGGNAQPDLATCGVENHPCCDGVCDVGECVGGLCQLVLCGTQGQLCCDGMKCNDAALACVDNLCILDCGRPAQACCPGDQCIDPNTVCRQDLCQAPPVPTGAPCKVSQDCEGAQGAACFTMSFNGPVFPGGYCSAKCDPAANDSKSGINPGCPGVGVCFRGEGPGGGCYAACTARNGAMPCRSGYSCFDLCYEWNLCFDVCYPTSASECAPSVPGSCGPGRGCLSVGPDDVGACLPTCDVFKQDCNQAMGATGCYVMDDTGQGLCDDQTFDFTDGRPCKVGNDCQPGLGCFQNGNTSVCRPFCGGPMNVLCKNGMQCVDFSAKVPVAVIGACAG